MEEGHHLRWKGKITGPYTAGDIRELLDSGEISRAHQIEVSGEWMPLDEFLKRTEVQAAEIPVQSPPLPESPVLQEDYSQVTQELIAERARSLGLQRQFNALREQQTQTLPVGSRPPPIPQPRKRVSFLALAALLVSLGSFFPVANMLVWFPTYLLADSALSAMKSDPKLRGSGLAKTALTLACIGLALGLVATLGWGFRWLKWW